MFKKCSFQKFISILAASLALGACGGSGSPGGGPVTSLEDVKSATVQIVAKGSFYPPQIGAGKQMKAGSGSGFIIDPSGIAVTNNHVVSGAASLEVYVGGEENAHNAKILGVSECSDLAVIDIEGEGFPYMEWYEGEIEVGMDVYAVGFPLGDPEFTLTKGIVSKEKTSGDTPWSSVDRVIEHDATINPGNSGGPLITEDGKVVAVNYLKSAADKFIAAQFFAIAREEAVPIIEKLRQGEDVDSVGLNGEVVNDGQGNSGIWVASVRSGTSADTAGIKGGDILLTMEGLVLGVDYTMSDYCDILRSHYQEDALTVLVLRYETEEVLEGQINGRPLELSFSFGKQAGSEVAAEPPTESSAYSGYMVVTNDQNEIQMEVPVEWNDIRDTTMWDYTAMLDVSSNLVDRDLFYAAPGVRFIAWNSDYLSVSSVEEELDSRQELSCTYESRYTFEKSRYRGMYDVYSNCNGEGGPLRLVLVVEPKDAQEKFLLFLMFQVMTEDDLYALDHILATFEVIGEIR